MCNLLKIMYRSNSLNLSEELRHLNIVVPDTHEVERSLFVHEHPNGDVLMLYKNDIQFLHGATLILDGTFKSVRALDKFEQLSGVKMNFEEKFGWIKSETACICVM